MVEYRIFTRSGNEHIINASNLKDLARKTKNIAYITYVFTDSASITAATKAKKLNKIKSEGSY